MKLIEWIRKEQERLNTIHRSAEYDGNEEVKVARNSITENFMKSSVDLEADVKDFNQEELTGEIKAVKVTFLVLMQRARKKRYVYSYDKLTDQEGGI